MTANPWTRPKSPQRCAMRSRGSQAALLLVVLLGVARCAAPASTAVDAGRPAAPLPTAAHTVGAGPPSQETTRNSDSDGKPIVFNDPPAAPDTPLCGRQAREVNAIGAVLQGPRVSASGICARFACYDPLTATYIGADGYRHVCR